MKRPCNFGDDSCTAVLVLLCLLLLQVQVNLAQAPSIPSASARPKYRQAKSTPGASASYDTWRKRQAKRKVTHASPGETAIFAKRLL